MINIRRALIGAAAFLLGSGLASAATIQYSFTQLGPQLTDFGPTAFTTTMFDSATYGTLTGITISFTGELNTTLSVTNNGTNGSSSGNAKTELQIGLDDNSSFTVTGGILASHGNFAANGKSPIDFLGDPQGYSLSQGATTNFAPDDVSSAPKNYAFTSASTNWAAIASEFTGVGNYSLFAQTYTSTVLANTGGNTLAAQTTQGTVTGTVTYTYTPGSSAPEPATMFLMGSALVGVGLLRKRIRS